MDVSRLLRVLAGGATAFALVAIPAAGAAAMQEPPRTAPMHERLCKVGVTCGCAAGSKQDLDDCIDQKEADCIANGGTPGAPFTWQNDNGSWNGGFVCEAPLIS